MERNLSENMKYNHLNKYRLIIVIIIYCLIKSQFYNLVNHKIPKVSVFMPIYNKEKYLIESIKSIQNQTLKDIEIIAVNDGSTDNSLKIIKNLTKIDKRIKIVNNDRNHGLLYSRAMGIINSTGEYVFNLDPDDKLSSPINLKLLYDQARLLKVDTIKFIIKKIKGNNNNHKNIRRKLLELNNSFFKTIRNDYYITNKFIKREVIIKCFNEFKDKIFGNKWNFHEDNVWSLLIHKYSKSIKFINASIYFYFQNKESLIHNRFNQLEIRNIVDKFGIIQNCFNYKNIYNLNQFLFYLNKYYQKIIKKDLEIRKKIINKLNIFLYKNRNNSDNLIINKIHLIKNLMSNNKIILINQLNEENLEENLLYITIYNFLKKYIDKTIVIFNKNDKIHFNLLLNYINPKDIFLIFDKKFCILSINNLMKKFPNNKILLFTGNIYFFEKNESYYSKIDIKNRTVENNNKYNYFYIKDYLYNISNFFNYKNYISKNNILIIFKENQTNNYKKKINKIISNNLSGKVTFVDNYSSYYSTDNILNLIKLLTNFKIIITDDINIMKISSIYYLSCILIIGNQSFDLNGNLKNLDYIEYINNVTELEKTIIKIRNKFILEKDVYNYYFNLLKQEFDNNI